MALPVIDVPTFNLNILGTNKSFKFRGFLVKEEKILTLAVASEDLQEMFLACKQVVSNCCLDDLDVSELSMYQLQWIFLQLKGKSIGTEQSFTLQCGGCQDRINYDMNIEEFEVIGNTEESTKKIEINENSGIVFKYPSADVEAAESELTDVELLVNCIKYIYNEEEVTYPKDEELKDLLEFVENLPLDIYKKAGEFFSKVPTLGHKVEYTCKKCETENVLVINGYEHFFG